MLAKKQGIPSLSYPSMKKQAHCTGLAGTEPGIINRPPLAGEDNTRVILILLYRINRIRVLYSVTSSKSYRKFIPLSFLYSYSPAAVQNCTPSVRRGLSTLDLWARSIGLDGVRRLHC